MYGNHINFRPIHMIYIYIYLSYFLIHFKYVCKYKINKSEIENSVDSSNKSRKYRCSASLMFSIVWFPIF